MKHRKYFLYMRATGICIASSCDFNSLRTSDMDHCDWGVICKHPGKGRFEARDISTGEFLPPAKCRKLVESLRKARARNGFAGELCVVCN